MSKLIPIAGAVALCALAVQSEDPLACQTNAAFPMLPIFHIIGNVTKDPTGSIKLEAINDCSGVTFYEGIWHVWHQCCQNHWDHMISKDLIHWQRVPPPIQPVTTKTWDGSISMLPAEDGGPLILYDAQDGHLSAQHGADGTSKVGSGDRPVLGVARLADPNDKYLVKWVRAPENPVKFDGAPGAFPGQVWKNDDHWNFIMQGKRYQSNDSKFMEWTTMDNMIGKGEHGGQWWSPVPNQVGGAAPPAGVPNYIVNVGGGDQYLFGQYSAGNETFAPWQLNGNEVEAHLEHGQAGWWGAQMANERMLMIGWATPDFHGDGGPGINFLTRLTLLREVNFDAKTMNLVSNPVPELVGLRSGSLASERAVAMSPDAKVIAGTGGGAAASADVNISFSGFKDGDSFGVCVLSSANGSTGIGISITVANKVASVKTGGCKEMMKASTRARTNANVSRYMPNTNFPKGDIRGLDHEFPTGTNWTACQGLCDKTAACEAWTFLARGGGMSCCIKGAVANDGCPAYARGMVSGAKTAGSVSCKPPGPGPKPPGPVPGVPIFDETEIIVRITPDRSVADFFVQGGRWSGTLGWPGKVPRAAVDSNVAVWGSAATVIADVDVFSMGCGWEYPSYTENPTL